MYKIIPEEKKKHIEQCRKWRAENKEKIKEYNKKWRAEHIGYYNFGYNSGYNSESKSRTNKKYRATHKSKPEKTREYWHKRRARHLGAVGGHFTEKEWRELLNKTGNKCLCCGATDKTLQRDHIIPLGTPHSDEISNIQPLCGFCNNSKHRKIIDYR